MTDVNAPERIWAKFPDHLRIQAARGHLHESTEYIRADIAEAQVAKLTQELDEANEDRAKVILACPMTPDTRTYPAYLGVRELRRRAEAAEAAETEVARLATELAEASKVVERYENWQPMTVEPGSLFLSPDALLCFAIEDDDGQCWKTCVWGEQPDGAYAWCPIVTPLGPSRAWHERNAP